MDTKTALIAVAAVALQVAVSYVLSRQHDNDLRRNIGRDIELIRALRPGSDEVAALEATCETASRIWSLVTSVGSVYPRPCRR